ncbi:M24 family metallopeptidase [bacterium]|nr:M24 family metallopeptidase [bacterium]
MDTQLIEYLRNFLIKNDIDGLVINSTNEFLVEYNRLDLNARYYVTGFTGSTGDVFLTSDKIYQFVDTRYHEQADNQVDHDFVDVVKIPLTKSSFTALTEIIPSYYKVGVVATKTSKRFYELLVKNLKMKNSIVKLINIDPVIEFKKESITPVNYNVFQVSKDITGLTADEKFEQIKQHIDGNFNILVTSLEDIAYITNLRSYDFDYSAIFPAKAIITNDGINIYTDCSLPFIGDNFKIYPFKDMEQKLKSITKSTIYIDEEKLSIYDYNLISPTNKILKSYLSLFKTVKNDNELEHMKKCFERSDRALKVVYDMLNSNTIYSEYDYYEALIKSMKENGALSLSFKPIVAAGSNTSIIHYSSPSKEKMVNDGDFLLVDYGGYYEGGIATDTTRTFIKGTPSAEQKIVYTTVLKAFLNAYYTKYDKKASYFSIDKVARDIIDKNISPDYPFAHGTGHGVGISVHENPPRVSSAESSKTKIIENTVFSIEPGAYKEGWGGIRIENTVYAKYEEDKITMHTLSHFPFEIKLIDLSVMNDFEKFYYMKWQAASCVL